MTLLGFLMIITLLDNLRRDFKVKWFNLWLQTRSSLSYFTKRSSVDHSLAISPLKSSDTTKSLFASYKLVGGWY